MTTPTLPKILSMALDGRLAGVRVALPGRVVSYDPETWRADVQPLVGDRYEDENRVVQPVRLPVVSDVPVLFQGSGDYSSTFPITKGDTVLLVCCSSSIARWKSSGSETDPADDRRHTISDAVAIPGLRHRPSEEAPDDAWVISTPTGKQIRLGSTSASQSAIKGDAFKTQLDLLLTALDTFANLNIGGPALTTAINTFKALWSTMLATKVKVE